MNIAIKWHLMTLCYTHLALIREWLMGTNAEYHHWTVCRRWETLEHSALNRWSSSNLSHPGSEVMHKRRQKSQRTMVVNAFKPSTQEAEAWGSVSSRPAWSTERVPGQALKLYRIPFSKKQTNKQKTVGMKDTKDLSTSVSQVLGLKVCAALTGLYVN